jgi:predicted permease
VTPPRLATLLLRLTAPRDARPFVLGDLRGEYERLVAADGRGAARRWYRRQARASVLPFLRVRLHFAMSRTRSSAADLTSLNGFVDALRWIRRHPWVSGTVVGTLGIALAASLAAFAVADSAVFRPLPYPAAGELVRVWTTGPTRAPNVRAVSLPDFRDLHDRSRTLSALAAYAPITLRLSGRGEPREVTAMRVSETYDRILALPAAAGRYFQPPDFETGAGVAIVSHAFAAREFGSAAAAIDRPLTLDDLVYRIVGVLPDRPVPLPFEPHDLWIPLRVREGAFWEPSRGTGWLTAIGRLAPDAPPERAEAELTGIALALAADHPATNHDKTVGRAARLVDDIAGPVAAGLALLGAALGAVLSIACGNAINLLLAVASAREREFAVRAAAGASRARLLGQLAAEHAVLAAAAGVLAVALAPPIARLFLSLSASPRDLAAPVEFGGAFAGAAGVAVAIVAAALTIPVARRVLSPSLVSVLHARGTASRRDGLVRHGLVALQVTISVLLIAGGIAFARTVARLAAIDTGFVADRVLTFTATPSPTRYRTGGATLDFYRSVVTAIERLPGVESAAAGVGVPLTSSGWQFGVRPPGAQADTLVTVNLTTERYFETLGVRLLEGRLLTADEQRSEQALAVVNEPLAQLIGANRPVLGFAFPYSNRTWTIVGVVAGARQRRLREPPMPELFIPWGQAGQRPQTLVVRTTGALPAIVPAIVSAVHAIDPSTPVASLVPLEERLRDARRTESSRAALLVSLAVVAILLAAFGAYSVSASAVAARRREYGIRLALGARPMAIQGRALLSVALPAVIGACVGAAAVVGVGEWLTTMLFETDPRDGLTLAAVAVSVCAVATAAGLRSARAASRTDPLITLRAE